MTEKRPTLAKKQARTEREGQDDDLNIGGAFFIDGTEYAVTLGDLNALDARACREQVGMSFPAVVESLLAGNVDIDIVAAVVWMARRVNGGEPDLSYAEVAAGIGYDIVRKVNEGAAAERARVRAEASATSAKKTTKKAVASPEA